MTTVSSPRASTPNIPTPVTSSAPSARSSVSLERPAPPQGSTRRNRTALRDYYNLSSSNTSSTAAAPPPVPPTPVPHSVISQFDKNDFDAKDYVDRLLEEEDLAKIMKVESELLSDIRGLDGERKALVYDNYSKLIDATETIGRVRELLEVEALTGQRKDTAQDALKQDTQGDKGDGVVDGKGKLDDLVDRVVAIALRGHADTQVDNVTLEASKEKVGETEKQKQTVRWVLNTPQRIETALQDGRRNEAQADWEEVKLLLFQWKDVGGVGELKSQCEELLTG